MLIKSKRIKGYKLNAIDGEIGSVKEFYFDDRFWTVRYLIANTGSWINNRQVLISPYFLESVNQASEVINVNLTKQQIEDSPTIDNDKPVSRQFEESYAGYYGSPFYWGGPHMWGTLPYLVREREKWNEPLRQENSWNPNLRSSKEVIGYNIQATDDEIGHVDDFIIEDETWAIRYMIVDTRNWWPGKKVLISPAWIDRISWDDSKVFVTLTRDAIKQAPEYDEDIELSRDYESNLHRYYNRQGYWTMEPAATEFTHR